MLTKNDLQAIRGVVNDGVQIEVDQVIKKGFKELLRKELKPIHQKLNKLDKKIDLISRVLDTDIVSLDKRVIKLEDARLASSSLN